MITKTVKYSGGDYITIMEALNDASSYMTNPMTEDIDIIVYDGISDKFEGIPELNIPIPFSQENNGFTFTIKRAE